MTAVTTTGAAGKFKTYTGTAQEVLDLLEAVPAWKRHASGIAKTPSTDAVFMWAIVRA